MSLARRNGRATAVATVTAPVRVAVYCRKSTEEGLDQAFNSLDAQREAGETYVGLHREEGWVVLPDRYDDGGFSGGSTNRPGLQRLLADVEVGKIDCVVVHKYDRLSRSMLDFLQLLDFFKRRGVSFVSVSQRFDTSTPVGEMTLNILLSFAQFERQIIAERTRDKVHAARRRGRWTGGMPPLGYDVAPEGGRLVVNKDEAEQVRAIFDFYVEKGSLVAAAEELNRRGLRRKSWVTKTGTSRAGKPWDRVNLHRILTDPIYTGMQKLGDDVFPGEHQAIVPKALFQRVQRILAENRTNGGAGTRNGQGFLLRGLVRCAACDASMVPSWTRKANRTYRYYTCGRAQKQGHAICPTRSVKADAVEAFIANEIKRIGKSPELQAEVFREAVGQLAAQRRGLKAETKRLERDLVGARGDVERLVGTLSRTTGVAGQAVQGELARTQERVGVLESRLVEVRAQEAAPANQHIDEADVARALEAFDPIWDVLLTPERERVLRLLIGRVTYDGASQKLEITFSPAGIATLAAEVGGGS